jgi:dihydrofolate reductase
VNIVLTKNKNYQVKDAVIVHSEEELLEELKKYPSEKIYVIGGGNGGALSVNEEFQSLIREIGAARDPICLRD